MWGKELLLDFKGDRDEFKAFINFYSLFSAVTPESYDLRKLHLPENPVKFNLYRNGTRELISISKNETFSDSKLRIPLKFQGKQFYVNFIFSNKNRNPDNPPTFHGYCESSPFDFNPLVGSFFSPVKASVYQCPNPIFSLLLPHKLAYIILGYLNFWNEEKADTLQEEFLGGLGNFRKLLQMQIHHIYFFIGLIKSSSQGQPVFAIQLAHNEELERIKILFENWEKLLNTKGIMFHDYSENKEIRFANIPQFGNDAFVAYFYNKKLLGITSSQNYLSLILKQKQQDCRLVMSVDFLNLNYANAFISRKYLRKSALKYAKLPIYPFSKAAIFYNPESKRVEWKLEK
ncbi:hypothetical protein ACFL35_04425 [Candidatus Riflebacteria bacterium]